MYFAQNGPFLNSEPAARYAAILFSMDLYDSPERQDERARERIRPSALFVTWILLGTLFAPWVTTGPFTVFGRYVHLGAGTCLLLHYLVTLLYTFIVGGLAYRCKLAGAFLAGPFIGLGLFFLNFVAFSAMGFRTDEMGGLIILHIIFGMIATACYKGFSVPRILVAH